MGKTYTREKKAFTLIEPMQTLNWYGKFWRQLWKLVTSDDTPPIQYWRILTPVRKCWRFCWAWYMGKQFWLWHYGNIITSRSIRLNDEPSFLDTLALWVTPLLFSCYYLRRGRYGSWESQHQSQQKASYWENAVKDAHTKDTSDIFIVHNKE